MHLLSVRWHPTLIVFFTILLSIKMFTGGVAFGATFSTTVKSQLPSSGMFAASAAASASPNTLSKNGGGLFGGGIGEGGYGMGGYGMGPYGGGGYGSDSLGEVRLWVSVRSVALRVTRLSGGVRGGRVMRRVWGRC